MERTSRHLFPLPPPSQWTCRSGADGDEEAGYEVQVERYLWSINVHKRLLGWRNTPREYGDSPAQNMLERSLCTRMPSYDLRKQTIQNGHDADNRHEVQNRSNVAYNKSTRDISPLANGQNVVVQNHITKKWNVRCAVHVAISSRRTLRMAQMYGVIYGFSKTTRVANYEHDATPSQPRKSNRVRKIPERYES